MRPSAGRLFRPLLIASLLAVLVVALAGPASAHTRAQASSNYRSDIVSAPAIDGVEWRMYAGGDLISVTNESDHDLVVEGYEGEPFLRVGPEGVFENRNSPATYLNTERYADVAVPPRADASAAPEWVRIGSGPTRAWHDHRVHWMSPTLPQAVTDAGGGDVDILDWAVPFTHGGHERELTGTLRWVEAEAWWPWLIGALLLTAPLALGVARGSAALPSLVRPAAVGVAAVALLNTIHFVDELLAWPSPTLDILFGLFHTALFVGVGLAGAAIAWHGRQGPLLSLGIASGAVILHQGLLQLTILTSSQLPTIWPPNLLRAAVALSLAQGVWVTVVVVAAHRLPTDQDGPRVRDDRAGQNEEPQTPDAENRHPHKELI